MYLWFNSPFFILLVSVVTVGVSLLLTAFLTQRFIHELQSTCVLASTGIPTGDNSTCFQGSLNELLRFQTNITIWRSSLRQMSLGDLLPNATSSQILVVPMDSGMTSCVCPWQLDLENVPDTKCPLPVQDDLCVDQGIYWRHRLSDESGVGLLMLHWAQRPDDPNQKRVTTLLDTVLNTTDTGENNLIFGTDPDGREWVSLAGNKTVDSSNTTIKGDKAYIMQMIKSCTSGTVYITDKPLVPKDLPKTSINWVPGLENVCWKNILNVLMNPENQMMSVPWGMYKISPGAFHMILDPKANVTMFGTETNVNSDRINTFSKLITIEVSKVL